MLLSDQYIAGLFDGEGTCGVYPSNSGTSFVPKLAIANGFRPILDMLHEQIGGRICDRHAGSVETRRGAVWAWTVEGVRNVRPVVERLIPHSIIKLDQLLLMIDYCETEPDVPYRGAWNRMPDEVRELRGRIAQQLRDAKHEHKVFA